MKKKIPRQLFKEFWFPGLVATLWTVINAVSDGSPTTWLDSVKIFGPTFFFISWLLAQYWRISKQISLESKLTNLDDNLRDKTDNLVNHITGGDSFFYYRIGVPFGPNLYRINCVFHGDYTLRNSKVFFFSKNSTLKNHKLHIPNLNKTLYQKADQLLKVQIDGDQIRNTIILFSSMGKEWSQYIVMKKSEGKIQVNSVTQTPTAEKSIEENYEVDYYDESGWMELERHILKLDR